MAFGSRTQHRVSTENGLCLDLFLLSQISLALSPKFELPRSFVKLLLLERTP